MIKMEAQYNLIYNIYWLENIFLLIFTYLTTKRIISIQKL